jgi:hypothetical protein
VTVVRRPTVGYRNGGLRGVLAGGLVPLAFHVDYWDRLGWSDRFASPHFTERQYRMASLARSRLVYTPQFLRNGRDWRSAGSPLEGLEELPPGCGHRARVAWHTKRQTDHQRHYRRGKTGR